MNSAVNLNLVASHTNNTTTTIDTTTNTKLITTTNTTTSSAGAGGGGGGSSSDNSNSSGGAGSGNSANIVVIKSTQQQQSITTSPPISTNSATTTTNNNNSFTTTANNSSSSNNATTTNGSITMSESMTSTEGHRTPNVDNLSKTNLYIRGLKPNTRDQDLYSMCSRFGSISSTKAILDKFDGCCRGYGFVEFVSPQSACLAVQELTKSGIQAQMAKITPPYLSHQHNHHHQHNPHQQHQHHHHHNNNNNNNNHHHQNQHHHQNNNNISGGGGGNNNIHVNNSDGQQQNQNSSSNNNADPTNLYIANLPPNMNETELETLLSTYGPVVSTRILRDSSNIPRGVGFARMETRDKCEQIIEQLNGRPYKNWKEPLLVKFADGGNKKHRHHNNHQYQHHNNNLQHHKVHQEDNRWRENSNTNDMGSVSSFDHQGNISHSNHLSDLAMISTLGYSRMQPGYPTVPAGSAYPPPLGPPTSAPQWIHPGGPGQPYVIPQQMLQASGLGPSNQAAAAAAALHYGHIPQLTSQMQGLQIAHPGAPVGGYLPPQHQWSPMWTHTMPPQQPPQPPSMRLAAPPMQPPPPPQASQQQSPRNTPIRQQQQQQAPPTPQQPLATDNKLQVSMPL